MIQLSSVPSSSDSELLPFRLSIWKEGGEKREGEKKMVRGQLENAPSFSLLPRRRRGPQTLLFLLQDVSSRLLVHTEPLAFLTFEFKREVRTISPDQPVNETKSRSSLHLPRLLSLSLQLTPSYISTWTQSILRSDSTSNPRLLTRLLNLCSRRDVLFLTHSLLFFDLKPYWINSSSSFTPFFSPAETFSHRLIH